MLPRLYVKVCMSDDKHATVLINEHGTPKKTREITKQRIYREQLLFVKKEIIWVPIHIFSA